VENIWQYLPRQLALQPRLRKPSTTSSTRICDAWNKLTAEPEIINLYRMRNWAHIGQSK